MVVVKVAVVVVHVPHNAGQSAFGTTPNSECCSYEQRSAVMLAHTGGSGNPPGQESVVVVTDVTVVTVVFVVVVEVTVAVVAVVVDAVAVDVVSVSVVVVDVVAVSDVVVDVVVVLHRPL